MAFVSAGNLFLPNIPDNQFAIFWARSDFIARVGDINNADSTHMIFRSFHFFFLLHVDYSYPSSLLTYDQAFAPLDTADVSFNYLLGLIPLRRPNIRCIVENDADVIFLAPV